MILKKVKITNYRQLQNVELDMQDSLTVLAGPMVLCQDLVQVKMRFSSS